MNNQTADLLNQLAQKLGTTTEYLWNILLHQAPTSATINLVQCLILISIPIITYKTHKRLLSVDKDGYDGYSDKDAYAPIMIFAVIVSIVAIILVVFSFDNIFNGYFNPEYWALDKLLNTITPSN